VTYVFRRSPHFFQENAVVIPQGASLLLVKMWSGLTWLTAKVGYSERTAEFHEEHPENDRLLQSAYSTLYNDNILMCLSSESACTQRIMYTSFETCRV
jgi:hypothetical protein